jgi:hypothetical protein
MLADMQMLAPGQRIDTTSADQQLMTSDSRKIIILVQQICKVFILAPTGGC